MPVNHELIRLGSLLSSARKELFPLVRRRITSRFDVAEQRAGVARKLLDAMEEVDGLAKRSTPKVKRGAGGVPSKARWYQLMAYIAQILDGVLRNVEMGKVQEKLELLEKTVEELQKQTVRNTN